MIFQPGLFRCVLAAMVVASHLSNYEIGRPSVFIFFALSGYWVSKMYAEKYAPNYGLRTFYISRFLRIWAPFAAAMLIFGVILSFTSSTDQPISAMSFLLLGIASTDADVLGVSWSLDIEAQFYLALPLIVLGMSKSPIHPRSGTLAIVALLTMCGIALSEYLDVETALYYAPCFACGIWIYRSGFAPSSRSAWASLGLFIAAGLLTYASSPYRPLLLKDQDLAFSSDVFLMPWTILLTPFVAWNVRQQSSPLDRHLGNFSFSLYIIHWPIISMMKELLGPLDSTEKVIVLCVILVVSTTFYLSVDRPLEALREQVVRRVSRTERRIST
ncbi:acyltransferase family protein [Roseibium aestuarii]|uniref:Acyltransferase family protein n=1 Tax=Roseibium aestuarii TaxID=2600299 RepID=A0ABW4JQM6_9HYPH|nr:acyltransferase [Roseibium aestuarii]